MALVSFLKYTDASLQIVGNTVGTNKVSSAKPEDLQFYDRAAYRRMEQIAQTDELIDGDQNYLITSVLFPKASIEILNMLEFGWWPLYVERTLGAYYYKAKETSPGLGQTMTAMEPSRLVKDNQRLIQLEVYKAIEIFYSTLITDNSNINEKDSANLAFARKRFEEEWQKAVQESAFYDQKAQGFIGTYQQDWLADVNFFEGDRRYF
jgi:hypothetical protein